MWTQLLQPLAQSLIGSPGILTTSDFCWWKCCSLPWTSTAGCCRALFYGWSCCLSGHEPWAVWGRAEFSRRRHHRLNRPSYDLVPIPLHVDTIDRWTKSNTKVANGFINLTGNLPFSEDFFIITFFSPHEVLDPFLIQLFEMYILIPWFRWIGAPEEVLPNIDTKVDKLHCETFSKIWSRFNLTPEIALNDEYLSQFFLDHKVFCITLEQLIEIFINFNMLDCIGAIFRMYMQHY